MPFTTTAQNRNFAVESLNDISLFSQNASNSASLKTFSSTTMSWKSRFLQYWKQSWQVLSYRAGSPKIFGSFRWNRKLKPPTDAENLARKLALLIKKNLMKQTEFDRLCSEMPKFITWHLWYINFHLYFFDKTIYRKIVDLIKSSVGFKFLKWYQQSEISYFPRKVALSNISKIKHTFYVLLFLDFVSSFWHTLYCFIATLIISLETFFSFLFYIL